MPILPIDLQTVFAQMANVGREQAVARDVPPLQQTAQAQHMVQTTYTQDRSVNETDDTREGEGVSPRREGGGGAREGEKKGASGSEGEGDERDAAVFRDPALGTHIDVMR
jgi:hypothetical protein